MAVGSPENGVESHRTAGAEGAPAEPRQLVLCPYCGHKQGASDQCEACHGLFDPLSRQATQNQMGPWFVRNERNPFAPGMSYERLRQMAQRGRLKRDSVIRGPSTRQFWALACNTPGIACLLGECHNCHGSVENDEYMCRACGVVLSWSSDRQHMGLSPIKLLPGEAAAAEVASSGMSGGESRPMQPASGPRPPTSAEVSSWSERVAGPPQVASARAPGTGAAIARSASTPPPSATGTVKKQKSKRSSSSSKRRRKRDSAQRNALIAVAAFSVVVVSASLVAVFGFGVGVEAGKAPAAISQQAPAPVPSQAQAPVVPEAPTPAAPEEQWLSAGALAGLSAWSEEIDSAREKAKSGEASVVRQAILELERVLAGAKDARTVDPAVISELEQQIATLRARADSLRLKELVGGG